MHVDISQKTNTPGELSGSESFEVVTVHSLSLMTKVPGMAFQSHKSDEILMHSYTEL